MSWYDKIGRIVVLNLAHREDRLLFFTEQAEKYDIPFERVEAIQDKIQGARGLRDSMVRLFNEEIAKGTEHLLVFEDDCLMVADEVTFKDTMEKVMEQLPSDYDMVFLGCQITNRISHFRSANLIPVTNAFSTHAVLYSLQGMKAVIALDLGYPIDNFLVEKLQPLGRCYCTYPLLASQLAGVSDIGGQFINWDVFISPRFEQRINEYRRQ